RLGVNLDTYFQTFSTGCITATATNIRNGGNDLNARYAGRDNLAGNAVSAIPSTGYTVGGSDIVSRFNRTGAVFNVAITGTTTYNGAGQTASIASYSPTNVVVPTITGSQTNAGTYGPASFTVGANIPTSYTKSLTGTYTIQQRVPYTGSPTFYTSLDNPSDSQLYNLYTVTSNLVGGSITVSYVSGNGYFYIAGSGWDINPHTTSTTAGGDFAESGVGTILFGVLTGGSSATFRINAGGNTNYTIVDLVVIS
ncbi:MAG: hypothetical protein EBX50_21400, partial [Chitinophagia bacterium]|nr:hypothetical protein [Chitinophagia bacterium]